MKLLVLAVFLVAGAYATEEVELGYGNRLADLEVKAFIERVSEYMRARGMDPYHRESHDFELVLVAREAEAKGHVKDVRASGGSNIVIETMKYNILWGILEYKIVLPRVKLSLGGSHITLIFRDYRGEGSASGRIEIHNLSVSGTAHLTYDIYGNTHIKSVYPELKVGRIDSEMKIVGKDRDYSETVNYFLIVKVLEHLETYKYEITTVLGEVVKFVYAHLKGW